LSPSSGPTCAGRKAALLALLGLALAVLPTGAGVNLAFGQSAPSAATTSPTDAALAGVPISLGFSPSTLTPVADGTPVYTVGDTVWVYSDYNYSVPVSLTTAKINASDSTDIVTARLLEPQDITPLYAFDSSSADGLWNLTVGPLTGAVVIPVRFVNLAAHPVSLGPLAYGLEDGNLSISTTAKLGDTYDQEVCAAGSAQSAGVSTGIPADVAQGGNVTLAPGSTFDIRTTGNVTSPFSFWFELYHPYALDLTSANSVVVSNLEAASSQPIAISSKGTANTTVTWNTPLRAGRYDMRTYFQSATNLDVVQSRLLILNSTSWVSLTSVCSPQAVSSPSIFYQASLTKGVQNWPQDMYVMFRAYGVEGVASYPVSAEVSSVRFVASPWNQTISDAKINVSPQPGVQTSQQGSSLFVLAQKYPVNLNLSLAISGGPAMEVSTPVPLIPAPFTAQTVRVSLAKLTVNVVSDLSAPSNVQVTGPGGLNVSGALTGSNQTMSLLLPSGSYSVSASQAGYSQSSDVALTDGTASSVTLNFNTFMSFEIILVVTAAIAAIANVLVFVLRGRGLGARLGPK